MCPIDTDIIRHIYQYTIPTHLNESYLYMNENKIRDDFTKVDIKNHVDNNIDIEILYTNLIEYIKQTQNKDSEFPIESFEEDYASLVQKIANIHSEQNITVETYPNGEIVAVVNDEKDFKIFNFRRSMNGRSLIKKNELYMDGDDIEAFVAERVIAQLYKIAKNIA